MKQLLTFQPLMMEFELEKAYHKQPDIEGTFFLQANKRSHIASLTLKVVQTIHISRKETETIVMGTKIRRKPFDLERLQRHELPFKISVKFPKTSKWEHKTYKGDLGPMNRATDEAKRQLYTYTIQAIVKLRGKKEPLTHEMQLRIEE